MQLDIPTLQKTYHEVKEIVISKAKQWSGRAVVQIKLLLPHLQDRRIAGLSLFVVNFPVIELALRTSDLVGYCLPYCNPKTPLGAKITIVKKAIVITLAMALTGLGNAFIVKKTSMTLHPAIVASISLTSFLIRYQIYHYLEPQSID